MDHEPTPEPALSAASTFPATDREIAQSVNCNRLAGSPERFGKSLQNVKMSRVDGPEPRSMIVRQDNRNVQRAWAYHDGPATA